MATFNRDSGKLMLIRKCTCGKEANYLYDGVNFTVKIECSGCGKSVYTLCLSKGKEELTEWIINKWNRIIEQELRTDSKI